jgi:uncharacterized protein (TIGR02001 family)
MRQWIGILGLTGGLALIAGTTHAQSPSWTVGAATDYRSRGFSKSDNEAYASVAAEWKSPDRLFYVGAQAATVDLATRATYEVEAKAGARPKIGEFAFDFTALYRIFPDARPGTDDEFIEARAQVSRAVGPVTVRALVWFTPNQVGPAEAATWADLRATWRVTPKARLSISAGRTEQNLAPDYSAWNAGVAYDLTPKVELDLRWYDTDAHDIAPRYGGEAVAAVTYRF